MSKEYYPEIHVSIKSEDTIHIAVDRNNEYHYKNKASRRYVKNRYQEFLSSVSENYTTKDIAAIKRLVTAFFKDITDQSHIISDYDFDQMSAERNIGPKFRSSSF